MADLTHERLREVLHYDPETGHFTWRGPRRGRGARNPHAGGRREGGYIVICIDGRNHRANRLAWFYVTGEWPRQDVDHGDGDPGNNRWTNLRDVPPAINSQNMKRPTGIEHRPDRPLPYRVRLTVDGKLKTVGSFKTEAEARGAREVAKCAWHPGYVPAAISRILPRASEK